MSREGGAAPVSQDEDQELTVALTSWRAQTTLTRATGVRAGGTRLAGVGSRESEWGWRRGSKNRELFGGGFAPGNRK